MAPITYKDAGVDIDKANNLVASFKQLNKDTSRNGVLGTIGGFSGFFSGRSERDNLDEFTESYDQLCVKVYCHEENFQRLDRVRELATAKNAAVSQIALAYVLCQPLDIYTLVGSRTSTEVHLNAEASTLRLSTEELSWLDLRSDTL